MIWDSVTQDSTARGATNAAQKKPRRGRSETPPGCVLPLMICVVYFSRIISFCATSPPRTAWRPGCLPAKRNIDTRHDVSHVNNPVAVDVLFENGQGSSTTLPQCRFLKTWTFPGLKFATAKSTSPSLSKSPPQIHHGP